MRSSGEERVVVDCAGFPPSMNTGPFGTKLALPVRHDVFLTMGHFANGMEFDALTFSQDLQKQHRVGRGGGGGAGATRISSADLTIKWDRRAGGLDQVGLRGLDACCGPRG
jgi:hypothetical protein